MMHLKKGPEPELLKYPPSPAKFKKQLQQK